MTEKIKLKCVLLGETAVGKSSLINRFVNGTFKQDCLPTIVGCYSTKEVFYKKENITIIYEIWDTAGQEKFRAVNRIFYQDAYIILLVYDITNKPSFNALQDYWYREVKDNTPQEAIIIIVGNKTDLYEIKEVNEDDVKNFCESVNALYILASAQTGEGVNELFDMIGKHVLTQKNFEEIKNKIEFRSKETKYSSISTLDPNHSGRIKCC